MNIFLSNKFREDDNQAHIYIGLILTEPTCIMMVKWFKEFQTEIVVEIYPKSLNRAIGKILLTIQVMKIGLCLVVHINNIGQ